MIKELLDEAEQDIPIICPKAEADNADRDLNNSDILRKPKIL